MCALIYSPGLDVPGCLLNARLVTLRRRILEPSHYVGNDVECADVGRAGYAVAVGSDGRCRNLALSDAVSAYIAYVFALLCGALAGRLPVVWQ